jgi:DNA replication protein DnaC
MELFTPCDLCKTGKKPGFIKKIDRNFSGSGAVKYVECECHKEWVKRINIESRISDSGLPWLNYGIEDYVGTKSLEEVNTLKRYANEWPTNKHLQESFLYIYGANGCQKTSFISLIGREICKYSKVKFLPIKRLYDTLRESHVEEKSRDLLDEWQRYDLLIIDEAMDPKKSTTTEWVIPFFDSFIRERLDYLQKGLIFISNIAPMDIDEKKFGTSLRDLVIRKANFFEFRDNYMATIGEDISVKNKENGLFPRK